MKKYIGFLAVVGMAVMNMAQAAGDIETGRALSTQCSFCHGTYGMSSSEQFPNIAGQKESYLVAQLKKYKSGDRADVTMATIVGPLNDQNIEDLAAYFAANSAVASYDFAAETLLVPYLGIGDSLFQVELKLSSPDPLTFTVSGVQER